MNIEKFSFIKDEPILSEEPGYFHFYHKSFSPALKQMILSDSCPHTIGLFSKWGTGKSSIINQLTEDLKGQDGAQVFVFDAWKYQEDSLRRTFLLKLKDFLVEKKNPVPSDFLSALYKNKINSDAKSMDLPEDTNENKSCWIHKIWVFIKRNIILISIAILILGMGIVEHYFPDNNLVVLGDKILKYWGTLTVLSYALAKPAETVLGRMADNIFESTKSYTLIRTTTEGEERLNSPEQFELAFSGLINFIKKGKLVVVFDNIDRVQGDVALKTLATIKTFLEVDKSKVVFLVPCDATAINKQISAFYNAQGQDDDFDQSEYLKKLFNVVVYTPEFIDEDLNEYTIALIKQTGADMKQIIHKEDVISVINHAFKNNPREIKQFINNLVSAVLVASKTEVADEILSEQNIGYFTKVTILKQKFPEAYKKLKENWNNPEKILPSTDEKGDQHLRDFLILTSTISTEDAEPFIHFKKSDTESRLKDPISIRKALLDENVEAFQSLVTLEANKSNLVKFIVTLFKKYKGQPQILFPIFKTQIQVFSSLKETSNNTRPYRDSFVTTIELIWNRYLELPMTPIFEFLPHLEETRRKMLLHRYVLVLASEEIKAETNKPFLYNLLGKFIEVYESFDQDDRDGIMDSICQNLEGRNDVLMQFSDIDSQRKFVDPEVLRKIIQENLSHQTLASFIPLLKLYQQHISNSGLAPALLERVPQLMSDQNADTPSTTPAKIDFYEKVNTIFEYFSVNIKKLTEVHQNEIFSKLQDGYNQSDANDDVQYQVINSIRWLETSATEVSIKEQSKSLIDRYIEQSSKESLRRVLDCWTPKGPEFIQDHFNQLLQRSLQDEGVLSLCYEKFNDEQKHILLKNLINNKSDHGLSFLRTVELSPIQKEEVLALLEKAEALSLPERSPIFHLLRGNIAENDDASIKQAWIKQIYEHLKSNDQAMIELGVAMLDEKFLSGTDHREIAKEMLAFYNTTHPLDIRQMDIPVLDHFVSIHSELQDALEGQLIFLILNNINSSQPFYLQESLISFIKTIRPNSDKYEKDYSGLIERLLAWIDVDYKDVLVKRILETLEEIPGEKAKEYIKKLESLIPAE